MGQKNKQALLCGYVAHTHRRVEEQALRAGGMEEDKRFCDCVREFQRARSSLKTHIEAHGVVWEGTEAYVIKFNIE